MDNGGYMGPWRLVCAAIFCFAGEMCMFFLDGRNKWPLIMMFIFLSIGLIFITLDRYRNK